MSSGGAAGVRRIQTIAISIAGIIAGVCFALSTILDGGAADAFYVGAGIFAILCAIIGVTFAIPLRGESSGRR